MPAPAAALLHSAAARRNPNHGCPIAYSSASTQDVAHPRSPSVVAPDLRAFDALLSLLQHRPLRRGGCLPPAAGLAEPLVLRLTTLLAAPTTRADLRTMAVVLYEILSLHPSGASCYNTTHPSTPTPIRPHHSPVTRHQSSPSTSLRILCALLLGDFKGIDWIVFETDEERAALHR